MGRACSRHGGEEECIQNLVEKPEGMRPLGTPRNRWVDNVKMDHREAKWGGLNWIDLDQNRGQWRGFVNTVMSFRIP
jgi:hypothetical protein